METLDKRLGTSCLVVLVQDGRLAHVGCGGCSDVWTGYRHWLLRAISFFSCPFCSSGIRHGGLLVFSFNVSRESGSRRR